MSYLDRFYIREIPYLNDNSSMKYYQVVKVDIYQANKLQERGEKIFSSKKQAYKVRKKLQDGISKG